MEWKCATTTEYQMIIGLRTLDMTLDLKMYVISIGRVENCISSHLRM